MTQQLKESGLRDVSHLNAFNKAFNLKFEKYSNSFN